MLKIELDGVKLRIPDSWEDISLKDYESWYLQKPETSLESVQHVADICKIDAKILLEAPTNIFDAVSGAISFVFDNDFEPQSKITIFEEDYYISQSDKLTLGEWVDIDGVLANEENQSKLSELLAILCRPLGEKYNPDIIEKRQKLFQAQTCDKVLPLIAFFLFKKKKSIKILNHYLAVIAQADQFLKDIKVFVKNGDGIKLLPIWQRIRFIYLTWLLKKRLKKCSDFFSTDRINHKRTRNNISLKKI